MNIDDTLAGNRAFVATARYKGLGMMPRRKMIVIGCADPRVDPERVLGLELGDAAVVRNIAGRVSPPTLATLAGLGQVGRRETPPATGSDDVGPQSLDVVILHHTDCGILRLADDPQSLAGFLGTDVAHVEAMHVSDPRASVVHDATLLRERLPMPGVRVWGLVYDVATGTVDVVVRPEEAQS